MALPAEMRTYVFATFAKPFGKTVERRKKT